MSSPTAVLWPCVIEMWLDDVLVPWERVFLMDVTPEPMASWLFWHQLYCWLSKAEFTLGPALACADAMGLTEHEPTIEYLVDLAVDVQTVRSCQTAAEPRSRADARGLLHPGAGARRRGQHRHAEGAAADGGDPEDPAGLVPRGGAVGQGPRRARGVGRLEESFGGGGYTALQRAALLQLASDHVSSALDGRESAFELHANGGIPAWRGRLRRYFQSYNGLANAVVRAIPLDMPAIDVSSIGAIPLAPRRPVTPRTSTSPRERAVEGSGGSPEPESGASGPARS